jgi:hypothetical protein
MPGQKDISVQQIQKHLAAINVPQHDLDEPSYKKSWDFLCTMFNVVDTDDHEQDRSRLDKKINHWAAQTQKRKGLIPGAHIPTHTKVLQVNDKSKSDDDHHGLSPLSTRQRRAHQAAVYDGRIVHTGTQDAFSTARGIAHGKSGWMAYTLNDKGEISIFNHDERLQDKRGSTSGYVHSQFGGSEKIISAGEVRISSEGQLMEISTYSGHYAPSLDEIVCFLIYLREQGVDVSYVNVHTFKAVDSALSPGSSHITAQAYQFEHADEEALRKFIHSKAEFAQLAFSSNNPGVKPPSLESFIIEAERNLDLELSTPYCSKAGDLLDRPNPRIRQMLKQIKGPSSLTLDRSRAAQDARDETRKIIRKFKHCITDILEDSTLSYSNRFELIEQTTDQFIAGIKELMQDRTHTQPLEQSIQKFEHFKEQFKSVVEEDSALTSSEHKSYKSKH